MECARQVVTGDACLGVWQPDAERPLEASLNGSRLHSFTARHGAPFATHLRTATECQMQTPSKVIVYPAVYDAAVKLACIAGTFMPNTSRRCTPICSSLPRRSPRSSSSASRSSKMPSLRPLD